MVISLGIVEVPLINYPKAMRDIQKFIDPSETRAEVFFRTEETRLAFIAFLLRRWGLSENILEKGIGGGIYVKTEGRELSDGFILIDNSGLRGKTIMELEVCFCDIRCSLILGLSSEATEGILYDILEGKV